jgi:hypothetical protein
VNFTSFRRGLHKDSIGKLLKRAAARASLEVDALGGYSLRAGCVVNGHQKTYFPGHRPTGSLRPGVV